MSTIRHQHLFYLIRNHLLFPLYSLFGFAQMPLFDDLTPRRRGFDSQSRVRILPTSSMEWDSLQVGGVGETPMGQQRAVDRNNRVTRVNLRSTENLLAEPSKLGFTFLTHTLNTSTSTTKNHIRWNTWSALTPSSSK